MYVSRCKLKDGPGYVKGDGGEDDGVVVEFKADVEIESKDVCSISACGNHFGTLGEE